ncbi:ATP-binding protein [Streptomyces sp. NPDC058783]|uniref:ATP-binding protein n=1 Tax=Streptomyces sp. NPDC058783 TaxID=3346633 RepID=UPI0036B8C10C
MTAPTPHNDRTETQPVTWRDVRPVPAQGLPLRTAPQPHYLPHHGMTWSLPGAALSTPAEARHHVRETCRQWAVPTPVAGDAELVVSELATNAVQHAPSADDLTLALRLSAGHLWLAVSDHGPRTRIRSHAVATAEDERGRGLQIVQALATRWVIDTSEAGTTAWACLALPADHQHGNGDTDAVRTHL